MARLTETSAPSSDAAATRRVRQLSIMHAPHKPARAVVELSGELLAIGREPDVEPALVLDDTEVSRRHADLVFDAAAGAWTVVDNGSRNGTVLDGVRVERGALRPGSVLRLGRTVLVYGDAEIRPREPRRAESALLGGPSIAMQKLRGTV